MDSKFANWLRNASRKMKMSSEERELSGLSCSEQIAHTFLWKCNYYIGEDWKKCDAGVTYSNQPNCNGLSQFFSKQDIDGVAKAIKNQQKAYMVDNIEVHADTDRFPFMRVSAQRRAETDINKTTHAQINK